MLLNFLCKRCAWLWNPRKDGRPKVCPRCHTKYWDVPPKVRKWEMKTKDTKEND